MARSTGENQIRLPSPLVPYMKCGDISQKRPEVSNVFYVVHYAVPNAEEPFEARCLLMTLWDHGFEATSIARRLKKTPEVG